MSDIGTKETEMKYSKLIRDILNTTELYGLSDYMCHVIPKYLVSKGDFKTWNEAYQVVASTFANELNEVFNSSGFEYSTSCLMVYMKQTNRRYSALVERSARRHATPGAHAMRVQWWRDYADELEAKGQ